MTPISSPQARIPRSPDEGFRLAELYKYKLLDTESDTDFDLLVVLAADICRAPYAFISLVDEDRVWAKAQFGAESASQVPRDDDYCSWAILENEILHVPDLTLDYRMANMSKTVGPPGYRMYCGANLITSTGQKVGTLCVLDTLPRSLSSEQQIKLVRLAKHVVNLMEARMRDLEYRSAVEGLSRLATRDELTGLLNRRALTQVLDHEGSRSRRFQSELSVLMIDIDHFKQVNDRYGHAIGDVVLRGVSHIVQAGIRGIDFASRYGGEELCVVLPGTDLVGAAKLAENLRRAVEVAVFRETPETIRVTVSIGIAAIHPLNTDINAILKMADVALYQAKSNGRNRVVVGHASGSAT